MMTALLAAVLCLACLYGLWLMSKLDRFLSYGKIRQASRAPREAMSGRRGGRAFRQFQSVLNHLLG